MGKDGGPAFPVKGGMLFYVPEDASEDIKAALHEQVSRQFEGMTLRQWYAGRALQGMLSREIPDEEELMVTIDGFVRDAFRYADTMLAHEAAEQRGGE